MRGVQGRGEEISKSKVSVAGSQCRRYHAHTFRSKAHFLPEPSFRAVVATALVRARYVVKGCRDVAANPLSLARGGHPDILVQPGGRPSEATTTRPPSGHAPADRTR